MNVYRRMLLAFGSILLAQTLACTSPPLFYPHHWPSIQGLSPGDPAEKVVEVLGKPSGKVQGWWSDNYRFDWEYQIWTYKGIGRVIFYENGTVVETQADPNQTGSSIGR